MEQPTEPKTQTWTLVIMILLIMLIIFDIIVFPLFYVLGIYEMYGINRGVCLTLGLSILIIGIVGILATFLAYDRAKRVKLEKALNSPEYRHMVSEYHQLFNRIQQSEEKIERMEEELRSLL